MLDDHALCGHTDSTVSSSANIRSKFNEELPSVDDNHILSSI